MLRVQKKLNHLHHSPAFKSLTKRLLRQIRQTVLMMNTTFRLPKECQLAKMRFSAEVGYHVPMEKEQRHLAF